MNLTNYLSLKYAFKYTTILSILILCSCGNKTKSKTETEAETNVVKQETVPVGTLEVVAELNDICPGNVALSNSGRIFLTTHGIRPGSIQLVEILDENKYKVFPDSSYQTNGSNKSVEKLDTPLGIFIDNKDRLWTIDAGFGIGLKGRLFAFDINTGKELYRIDIPTELTPPHSCVQDLVVDETNEWVYISDSGDPGIIALDLASQTFRKFKDKTMLPADIEMVIGGKTIAVGDEPFKIGMNPISISTDRETLYYGAMTGNKWYAISSKLFRDNASDENISKAINVIGDKPLCDGVSTSADGKHYLTNMQNYSIDVLDNDGNLSTLVKDKRIDWPDNVRLGPDGWLYISTNQLYKVPRFTGGEDQATKPFLLLRVKV